jgi:hypothetical protein
LTHFTQEGEITLPVPLINVKGEYIGLKIELSFECPQNCPARLHFIPVTNGNGQRSLENNGSERNLSDFSGGLPTKSWSVDHIYKGAVHIKEFCFYAADDDEGRPRLENLRDDGYFVRIPVGKADIEYKITYRNIKTEAKSPQMSLCILTTESTNDIASNLVCYSYDYAGVRFRISLPEKVPRGKKTFSPFLLPKGCSARLYVDAGKAVHARQVRFFLPRLLKKVNFINGLRFREEL